MPSPPCSHGVDKRCCLTCGLRKKCLKCGITINAHNEKQHYETAKCRNASIDQYSLITSQIENLQSQIDKLKIAQQQILAARSLVDKKVGDMDDEYY